MNAPLPTSRTALVAMTGSSIELLAANTSRTEAEVQNKGANSIAVLEVDVDDTAASLTGAGFVLRQFERYFVKGCNRVVAIGTSGDLVAVVEA